MKKIWLVGAGCILMISLVLACTTKNMEDQKARAEASRNLGEAYSNIGFVAIKNHGLSDELTAKLYDSVKAFFSLKDDQKLQYEIAGLAGQRGYVSKGKEKAKGRTNRNLARSLLRLLSFTSI